ncbi:MAG: ribosome rescue GTPase HflX [Gammaproteobacteria bacterium]
MTSVDLTSFPATSPSAGVGDSALLVHINFREPDFQEAMEEFALLADSAGVAIAGVITGSRDKPDARYFIGTGKAEEIRAAVSNHAAKLVIFNHELSPAQERNLERLLQCRVLDRSGLILDIFAQRARTYEGKLQVELAQLQHLSTRLVRGWTHLERQKGGIGLRGPGETQLETDRRLIGQRIKSIHQRLNKVRSQREQSGKQRREANIPVMSLIGYTNAGKSTLFNRLTQSGVYAADKLFATLDPTVRRCELASGRALVLSDTVGFIRHIPHDLIAAFRATLEETRQSDVLLHVIDCHDDEREQRIDQVNAVLDEIGAGQLPQVLVYNKIDREGFAPRMDYDAARQRFSVWLSAQTGAGMGLLHEVLDRYARGAAIRQRLHLAPTAGKLRSELFALGAVENESSAADGGWILHVDLEPGRLQRLLLAAGESVQILHD